MFGVFGKNKPVKIRGVSGNKKFGVAAKDVKELIKKGCTMLELPVSGARVCLYEDGTVVTGDFFKILPDNAELVLLSREQTWSGVVCDIAQLLNTDQYADRLIETAKGLLSGVDARFKTKSSYMKFNCESRIRGYMKELDDTTKLIQKAKVRAEFVKTSECLTEMLRAARYNGCYFDRTEKEPNRLCTREGWFTCQGSFDEKLCQSLHSINPYCSRENRILFSTWNLDHRIEKKRTIIPALLEALQNHRSSTINLDYFYRLLFTRENLKLVHVVCHKKGAHNLQCDGRKIFKDGSNANKAKTKRRVKKRCLD
ncbi:DNA fragmentation factor subunit beta isoform 2-T2 [Pholidichthys leucotaenia]